MLEENLGSDDDRRKPSQNVIGFGDVKYELSFGQTFIRSGVRDNEAKVIK